VLILELLKYAAHSSSRAATESAAAALAGATPSELQWALDGGFGPLAHRAVSAFPDRVPQHLRAQLQGGDLAARIQHEYRVETALDVIDACALVGARAMLLKGISISEQYYPAAHLRTMTDVDILALGGTLAQIESALLERGFEYTTINMGTDAAHGVPMHDAARNAWVEIHTALFPMSSPLQRHPVFAQPGSPMHSVLSQFRGRPVLRLTDEAQLLYIAAYWNRDLTAVPMQPVMIRPLLDAVILLSNPEVTIDWDQLAVGFHDDQPTACMYLLLACLARHELVQLPRGLLSTLAARQTLIGPAELRLINSLVDRYLLDGRPMRLFQSWHVWLNLLEPGPRFIKVLRLPWRVAFPPTCPHRFNVGTQARRLVRWITR
jgi:hypothetical protein